MSDDPTDDTDRLEAALERIATLAARRPDAAPAPSGDQPNSEVAARLDQLIAQLRASLSQTGA